jgi:hypothetical protein
MFPRGIFFWACVSVCITVGVSVGVWFFLFATELATEMGFTDDWFTDGALPSVNPSVLFSLTDLIAVTNGINPSVKLDNVVVEFLNFRLPIFDHNCIGRPLDVINKSFYIKKASDIFYSFFFNFFF